MRTSQFKILFSTRKPEWPLNRIRKAWKRGQSGRLVIRVGRLYESHPIKESIFNYRPTL